jgi:hypothetical protein
MTDQRASGKDIRDLCASCRYHATCIYITHGEGPVLHCEEFEVQANPHSIGCSEPVPQRAKEDNPVFGGLCKNCDNRKTCMNASPERIIWHCEEYI